MLPKAILFDLDDTIISFDGAAEIAWKKATSLFVEQNDLHFDSEVLLENINKVRKWYWGDTDRHKVGRMNMIKARREIVKMALENLDYFDEAKAYEMADSYSKIQDDLICLFPDSLITLERLKSMGIRMALITNGSSEKQRGKINRFCLSGYFEKCFIEEEVGFGKPDTGVFLLALEELGLKAAEVWMVGDNLVWDIEAPQKIGIYSIWNDFRKTGLPRNSEIIPNRIIHSISELLGGKYECSSNWYVRCR